MFLWNVEDGRFSPIEQKKKRTIMLYNFVSINFLDRIKPEERDITDFDFLF